MKKPFFSIIIPTYNRANAIHLPIDSILSQTFDDWELIIVDDGSTDNTREVVASYDDTRIKYVYQQNAERSAARNRGIDETTGDWICFQDSDDEYLPNHLKTIYTAIQSTPDRMIIKSGMIIYNQGREIARTHTRSMSQYDTFPYDCFQLAAFHKSVLTDLRFDPRFYIAEDLHFMLRAGMKSEITILPEWTGINHYIPTNNGITSRKYRPVLDNQKACIEDVLSWNETEILPFFHRKLCLNALLVLRGDIRYNLSKIPNGILRNIRILVRFPWEYLRLMTRIIKVRINRLFGRDYIQDLF